MIQAKFGLAGVALRTLEVYTSATLEAALACQPPVAGRMARDDGAGRGGGARQLSPRGLRGPALPGVLSRGDAGGRARQPAHRQPSGAARRRRRARRPARDPLAVRVDADAAAAGVLARRRRTGRRGAERGGPRRASRDVPALAVLSIAGRPAADDAGQGRPADRGAVRPAAGAARSAAAGRVAARQARAGDRRAAGHHRPGRAARATTRRCGARSSSAIPTSIRSICCRSSCCAGWPCCARSRSAQRDPDARDRASAALKKALKITISGVAAGMRNTG